jgi:hypothetical protein
MRRAGSGAGAAQAEEDRAQNADHGDAGHGPEDCRAVVPGRLRDAVPRPLDDRGICGIELVTHLARTLL